MMEGKRLRIMWWITGLAALCLLAVTAVLFLRANQIEESGIVGYVARSETAPFLRDRPTNNGSGLTVLEYGTQVRVSDSASRSDVGWYYVDAGEASGWVRASLISFDPP